ncbi:ROK family protein [Pontibacter liquoris]|uniref:ROK family protein n=1 Tax=Pontibacter liquoris TaxID=2905677 RepID=UPI001FA6ADAC|nr:ROK family protein [Pontibacter liquoris]
MIENKDIHRILTIDVGGSHIKATILNRAGELQTSYKKIDTPSPATPEKVLAGVQELVKDFTDYDRVSVGFPGYIHEGHVMTAPNLGTALWQGLDLQAKLADVLQKQVRVVNDADLQGLGVVQGKGFEMVITLGTGFGTALLQRGVLLPHLELAHHPVTKHKDYDQYIGDKALETVGEAKWNRRMQKVLQILKTVFNYDHLYISGGNADKLRFTLDDNITIVSNVDGIKGGARLWQDDFAV